MTGASSPGAAVHVWLASVTAHTDHASRLFLLLDAGERERAHRFHFTEDRKRYIISHALLRILLGDALGIAPEAVRWGLGPYGKPELVPPQDAALQFNLSHSGDLIAIALVHGRAVGVDVEEWRAVEYDEIGERFFSPTEHDTLRRLSESEKAAGFFTCWTRKEAYIKATGLGVSQGLDYFDVSLRPGEPARLIADRHPPHVGRTWTMHALDVPSGYSGAVVVEGDACVLAQHTMRP